MVTVLTTSNTIFGSLFYTSLWDSLIYKCFIECVDYIGNVRINDKCRLIGRAKIVDCFISQFYGGVKIQLHHSWPRHETDVSDHLHASAALPQGANWIWYWVSARACMDAVEKIKISAPAGNRTPAMYGGRIGRKWRKMKDEKEKKRNRRQIGERKYTQHCC
jgi:hypothetical protein